MNVVDLLVYFTTIKKCYSYFEIEIHEALLITKHNQNSIDNYLQMVVGTLNLCGFCYLDSACCIGFAVVLLRLYF